MSIASGRPGGAAPLSPDLDRIADDLEALSAFRDPDLPGWTRRVFTPLDRSAREWVATKMEAAGLEVTSDAAANLWGRLRGKGGSKGPAIMTGSHTDTVHGGGRFDGIIGVLGAIEAVRMLRDAGVRLEHDLAVIDFLGEEPNDFGLSCVGSRALVGTLDDGHLALRDPSGRTLAEALREAGGDPSALPGVRLGPAAARCFVELHIEQGPRLERAGIPIGVVTGIVGIHRFRASFVGRPDHAGTTPMGVRRDALLGAAEAALRLERLAEGGVATAGRLEARPGALNVVPAEADLWAEARSEDEAWLAALGSGIEAAVAEIGGRRRLTTSLEWVSREEPALATDWVAGTIEQASLECGLESVRLPSGAGHDASHMARLAPMGMIFVPSRDGRSHCPEEWTGLEQIGRGVAVLAESLRRCDRAEAV